MNIHRFHRIVFFVYGPLKTPKLFVGQTFQPRGPLTDLSGIEADQAAEKCLGDAMWLDG